MAHFEEVSSLKMGNYMKNLKCSKSKVTDSTAYFKNLEESFETRLNFKSRTLPGAHYALIAILNWKSQCSLFFQGFSIRMKCYSSVPVFSEASYTAKCVFCPWSKNVTHEHFYAGR